MKAFRLSRAAAGLTVFSALVATAMAAVVSTIGTIGIPSVDSFGSPNTDVVGTGTGKYYKDDYTGILTGSFSGRIINKSKAAAQFSNQGVSVTDPFTSETVAATSDLEVVSRPVLAWSKASLTVVYNPINAIP